MAPIVHTYRSSGTGLCVNTTGRVQLNEEDAGQAANLMERYLPAELAHQAAAS